jgi:hypothetical protein
VFSLPSICLAQHDRNSSHLAIQNWAGNRRSANLGKRVIRQVDNNVRMAVFRADAPFRWRGAADVNQRSALQQQWVKEPQWSH